MKLKPCECGTIAVKLHYPDVTVICCDKCRADGRVFFIAKWTMTEEEAETAWNEGTSEEILTHAA
jgi:hypothetical protein